MRSAELTEPGFLHDICSAIHPLLLASPFFRDIGLDRLGIEIIHPDLPIAHPVAGGRAASVHRSVDETADVLGVDGPAYRRLMGPLVERMGELAPDLLGPFRIPRHPFTLARFGLSAIHSAEGLARSRFKTPEARALFGGVAAHSMLPLDQSPTAGVGLLLLSLAHAVGWPQVRGGSQRIADGMKAHLVSLGGEVVTGHEVRSFEDLPPAGAYLFDVSPKALGRIAGKRLPARYLKSLSKYRFGPGVFKIDWAIDGPVPWLAEECQRAGTVHLGWSLEELSASEKAANEGVHAERPYVLVTQQSLFEPERAPAGKHTLWAYCHTPAGSTRDKTNVIEAQIERFAPGFRQTIISRSTCNAVEMEAYNANYVGGDINGGIQDLRQHFARPVARLSPYTTPAKDIYLCSSSTPPGGGVHGMCGRFAARAALRRALK
jgi:phytoene dehydrogenase-like protein